MSVMELQSKYFPIQPRGTLISSNTGILPSIPCDGTTEKPFVRLREPRDLYSTTSLQHPPKWPIECQVIPEKIRHIETAPAKLEPFYVTSNSEPQPKPVGEEMGTIVYDYQPKLSVDYFCRSCVGGSEAIETVESPEPNSLRFESRFESGNLAKAIKVTNVYYELYLRQDMYTDRHSQWFYFRIQNNKDNLSYRFSIVNFNKPDSLYRYGLKILIYSEKEAELNKVGWVRGGQNIAYFKNDIPSEENGSLYTLTFNLKFRHSNDTIYLAHCYPYTYTMLQNYLRNIEEDRFKSQLLTVRLLCRSLAGNNVYILTITSPDNYQEENTKKPAVVISARVHPGETQSSYMMKGIIDFLTSNSPQAQELRDRFIFKLIPMLNPDGVIVGNSRCCLLGQDLNRQYRTVLREAFPQIYHTKVMLRRLMEDHGIFLYCDIHGHSRRNNVFIYGCENRKFPEKKLVEQIFPLMMYKNATDKFSFQNCKFRVQKNKEGTGRVFAWTLGIVNSFTLEISLGGSTMPSRQFTHFNTADYEATGRHFCETLMDFSDPSPPKEKLRERILLKLMEGGSNADEPINVPLTDYSSLSHSESEGSCDEAEVEGKNTLTIPIKRQLSFRAPKKKLKLPLPIKVDQRPALSLNKASVDFIRLGQKQRKVEDTSSPSEFTLSKELALFKRLTKFRRKPRRTTDGIIPMTERDVNTVGYLQTPKCTSILFDDPFNPPGTFRSKRGSQVDETMEDQESGDHFGSEDECDECDVAIKNEKYARNYEVNPPDTDTAELVNELALLQISPQTKKLPSDTAPVPNNDKSPTVTFAPFIPKLPQGKPLRSFYSMDFAEEKLVKDANSKFLNPTQQIQTARRASLATMSTSTSTISDRRPFQLKGHYHKSHSNKLGSVKMTKSVSTISQRRVSWTEVGDRQKIGQSFLAPSGINPTTTSYSGNVKAFKKSKSITVVEKSDKVTAAMMGVTEANPVHLHRSQSVRLSNAIQESEIHVLSKKKRAKLKRTKSKKVAAFS